MTEDGTYYILFVVTADPFGAPGAPITSAIVLINGTANTTSFPSPAFLPDIPGPDTTITGMISLVANDTIELQLDTGDPLVLLRRTQVNILKISN